MPSRTRNRKRPTSESPPQASKANKLRKYVYSKTKNYISPRTLEFTEKVMKINRPHSSESAILNEINATMKKADKERFHTEMADVGGRLLSELCEIELLKALQRSPHYQMLCFLSKNKSDNHRIVYCISEYEGMFVDIVNSMKLDELYSKGAERKKKLPKKLLTLLQKSKSYTQKLTFVKIINYAYSSLFATDKILGKYKMPFDFSFLALLVRGVIICSILNKFDRLIETFKGAFSDE